MMKKERSNRGAEEKGFMFIMAYLLICSLSVYALALLSQSQGFLNASERNKNKIIAFNMAEAGVDTAIATLATSLDYAGTANYVPKNTTNFEGGYQIAVTTPNDNANIRMIRVTGYSPSNVSTSRAFEKRTVTAYVQMGAPTSLFEYAVFADSNMKLNGSSVTVDSYDSSKGDYDAAAAGSEGDVATNNPADGAIDLVGGALVKGDAVIGPGGDPLTAVRLSNQVTGTITAALEPKKYDLPTVPTSNVIEYGELKINGNQTVNLPGGIYHMTSIQITGSKAMLKPLGPVQLYVDGTVQIGGKGIATFNNSPPNLIIYSTSSEGVHINGNGTLYGGIFAPKSFVKNNGNATIYGAVVCEEYHQPGNADVHFDEALKEVKANIKPKVSLLSWREHDTTAAI